MNSFKVRPGVGRITKLAAALLTVAMLATACGGDDSSGDNGASKAGASGEIKLVMHTWPGWEPVLKEIIASFEKENPDIKVKYELMDYPDLKTGLTPRFASKNPPDVTVADGGLPWVQQGLMQDLRPFAKEDGTDFGQLTDTLNQGRKIGYDQQFGLPLLTTGGFVYYNKTMFEKEGVPLPTQDWTMDDFKAAAIALTRDNTGKKPTDAGFNKKKIKTYGASFQGSTMWEPFIKNFGGDLFNDDVSEAKLNDPNTVAGLKFMNDLACNQGAVLGPQTGEKAQTSDPFVSQRAAMSVTGEWLMAVYRDIKDFDWDIAAPPKGPSDNYNVYAASNLLGVSKDSKKPGAAWKFVKYLIFDKDAQIKLGASNGPALKEATTSEQLSKVRQGPRGPSPENIEWAYSALSEKGSSEYVLGTLKNQDKWEPLFNDFQGKLLTLCNEDADTLISKYQEQINAAVSAS